MSASQAAVTAYIETSRLYQVEVEQAIAAFNAGDADTAIAALFQCMVHADEAITQLAVLGHYVGIDCEIASWADWADAMLRHAHVLHARGYHQRTRELCAEALALRLRAISSRARH